MAEQPQKPRFDEIGYVGAAYGMYAMVQPTRPEISPRQRLRMREDEPVLAAPMYAIETLLQSAEWSVQPMDDTPAASAAAEWLEGALFQDMSHTWGDFVADVMTMLTYGWSYHEIVYKRRIGPDRADKAQRSKYTDGRIGIRKLAYRPQDTLSRWAIDEAGGVQGMWQHANGRSGGVEIMIPIERSLHFSTIPMRGSPEGRSLLDAAFDTWQTLLRIRESECVGIYRDLAGIPVARVPFQVLQAAQDVNDPHHDAALRTYGIYQELVQRLWKNMETGMVLPSNTYQDPDGRNSSALQYDVSLMSASGQSSTDARAAVIGYQKVLADAFLFGFAQLGGQGSGAFALSQTLVDVWQASLIHILERVEAVCNRHLIERLWQVNGFPRETMPSLSQGGVKEDDVAKWATTIRDLAAAGIIFGDDPGAVDAAYSKLGLPPRQEALPLPAQALPPDAPMDEQDEQDEQDDMGEEPA